MDEGEPAALVPGLKTPLRLTLAGLWAERLARAFWPLWTLGLGLGAVLAFGLQDHLTLDAFWYGAVSAAAALVWAAVHGLRAFQRPTVAQALARIDARLPGQPIAALADRQALGLDDPAAQALWAAHRARMAARAATATPVAPDLRLSSRDPYALRYLALSLALVAGLFGSVGRLGGLASLTPGGATPAVAAGPTWEGWVRPPAYTRKPALYLNDQTADRLALPQGSRVEIRLYGEPGALILSETVSGRTDAPPASAARQEFTVTRSGEVRIEGEGGRGWQVAMTPDTPPEVALTGEITRKGDGSFTQGFTARDDYGVTRGQAVLTLDLSAVDRRYGLTLPPEDAATATLDLPLPKRGGRAEVKGTLKDDLSKSLLANLPVTLSLTVRDAANQTGQTAPLPVTLPGKRFFDPFAAALIEMRRDLLWNRANAPRVVQVLRAVTWQPEGFVRNERAFLRLRVAMKRLEAEAQALTPALRDEVAEELWQVALMVEEGDLASALERLRRAQDRLDEAIRNGASLEEVNRLMDEMKQALDAYLNQLAREAEKRGERQAGDPQGPQMQMSQDQLNQMLDKLQELMDQGRTAEAAELMEQLRQFMENMQVTMDGSGQGQGSGGPGQQTMRELGDTLKGQQDLSDDAFRELQQGQNGEEPGEEPGQQPGGDSLADRQNDLQRRLDRLGNLGRLPGDGGELGEEGRRQLDRAGRAMDRAEEALREGDLSGAMDEQAEAMEALRDGMRAFGEAIAEEDRQKGTRRADQGDAQPGEGRDPLGRTGQETMRNGSDHNLTGEAEAARRAEELLEEIRRRSGELTRPEDERSYLKRLLDLF